MSEENEAVAPVETQEVRVGSPVAKTVFGAAGAVTAGHFASKALVNNGIKDVLNGKGNEAPKKIKKAVDSAMSGKGAAHDAQEAAIKALDEGMKDTTKVSAMKYVETADKKVALEFTHDGKKHLLQGIQKPTDSKLGEIAKDQIGQELNVAGNAIKGQAGEHLTALANQMPRKKEALAALKQGFADNNKLSNAKFVKNGEAHQLEVVINGTYPAHRFDAALPKDYVVDELIHPNKYAELFNAEKGLLKNLPADAEKALVSEIKTAEKLGIKSHGGKGYAMVIGAALAAAVVAGGIAGKIFKTTKHVDKVMEERAAGANQQQAVGA